LNFDLNDIGFELIPLFR